MRKPQINSVSDYLNAINEIKGNSSTYSPYVFRGQTQYYWNLISTIRRDSDNFQEIVQQQGISLNHHFIINYENHIYEQFKKLSFQYSSQLELRNEDYIFEWYSTMRHYGLPSRLIDCSKNPLVALYFAVENVDKGFSGCGSVFVISSGNNESRIKYYTDDESDDYHANFIGKNLRDYGQRFPQDDTNYFIYESNLRFSRIDAQDGLFIIPKKLDSNLFELESIKNGFIHKIHIHQSAKSQIFEELDNLGINHKNLFPDLAGLSEYLRISSLSKYSDFATAIGARRIQK